MAIQNNNDQRATGGSVLGYAIVQFDNGKLKLLEGGGIKPLDLSRTNGRFPVPPAVQWYIDYFNLPFRIKNGMNYTPDFPLVADAWARYVEDVRGLHVDGAIALDPFAIADVLRGQGTMHVPSYPGVVDGTNIVRVAEYDQYQLSKEGQAALPESSFPERSRSSSTRATSSRWHPASATRCPGVTCRCGRPIPDWKG